MEKLVKWKKLVIQIIQLNKKLVKHKKFVKWKNWLNRKIG